MEILAAQVAVAVVAVVVGLAYLVVAHLYQNQKIEIRQEAPALVLVAEGEGAPAETITYLMGALLQGAAMVGEVFVCYGAPVVHIQTLIQEMCDETFYKNSRRSPV
jgi:hypothetical protein